MEHLGLVSSSAEDDAGHSAPASTAGLGHNLLTVLRQIETLDLPHVRFDVTCLQGVDHLYNERRPQFFV